MNQRAQLRIAVGEQKQRPAYRERPLGNRPLGRGHAIDLDGLDIPVQKTQPDIPNRPGRRLHAGMRLRVGVDIFDTGRHIFLVHDLFMEHFVSAAGRIPADGHNRHIRPAQFLPVGNLAHINIGYLRRRQLVNRIRRMQHHANAVHRHRMCHRVHSVLNSLLEFFGLEKPAGHRNIAPRVNQRRHAIAGTGLLDRNRTPLRLHKRLGKRIPNRPHRRRAV